MKRRESRKRNDRENEFFKPIWLLERPFFSKRYVHSHRISSFVTDLLFIVLSLYGIYYGIVNLTNNWNLSFFLFERICTARSEKSIFKHLREFISVVWCIAGNCCSDEELHKNCTVIPKKWSSKKLIRYLYGHSTVSYASMVYLSFITKVNFGSTNSHKLKHESRAISTYEEGTLALQ